MHTRPRRIRILETLTAQKTVSIKALAEQFEVSSMTVRRDLRRLAEQGVVTLVHGGAVLNEGTTSIAAVDTRLTQMQEEKFHIGKLASSLVKEGNAVYIDAGSTAMGIAEALAERRNIAVLTHSLPVMNILARAKDVQLISIPGIYHPEYKCFLGELTQRVIHSFHIDIAFLGFSSVDMKEGLTTPDLRDAAVKREILQQTKRAVMAIDHTKIGRVALTKVADLNVIDVILTDSEADADFVARARRMGIEVLGTI